MKLLWLLVLCTPLCCGCEIVAKFYMDKSFVTAHEFDAAKPDMNGHAEIEVKLYEGKPHGK